MSSDDVELPEQVTLCMRCVAVPVPVADSDRRQCAACGRDVWVSPASQQSIAQGQYPDVVACMECVHEHENDS